jgi:S-DNA-T family DNA segregation ATPase FtsK/SpoIIIE
MASRTNKKRGQVEEPEKGSSELEGACWLLGGMVLLLSLLSYSPADLPEWDMFEVFSDKADAKAENWLGAVGGVLGFLQILIFGAAGWMLSFGFLWFGITKLVLKGRVWPKLTLGLGFVLVAGAVFFEVVDVLFEDWSARCNLVGKPGGVIGQAVGSSVLSPVIGRPGAIALACVVYLLGLIWLAGQAPLQFFRACYFAVVAKCDAWRASRSEAGRFASRERELLAERERQREQRKTEREMARTKSFESEAPGQKELAIKETPLPQIIDASQRRATDQLEAGAKPFERKKPSHQSLSVSGFADYELPGFDLLDEVELEAEEANHSELLAIQTTIIETLQAFGIEVTPGDITRGPTITRYEIYPSTGLRVSRISQLEADIARATCAERINILAPIPGKDTVGIEIANSNKVAVPLHELLHDPEFRSAKKKIPLALGKDVYGKTVIGDLAAMPHLLVAGATGSGKSVCINSIIASILFKFGPDELRFIMVDPKVVEMQMYNRLPHMVVPVVTDPKKTVAALKWVVNEMEKRYKIFAKEGVRNFDGFNNRPREEKVVVPEVAEADEPEVNLDEIEAIALALEEGDLGPEAELEELEIEDDEIPDRFPYIVVLIDELADLMQTAPADVEMCIARIAQKARAAGIHLIIATQTPRADVVTGIIKANIPSRIAFQVSSALDSRVILDTKGADKLVGKGDMLYLPPGSAKLERAQGAFVSDEEVERIVEHCANQAKPNYEKDIRETIDAAGMDEADEVSEADEELIIKCIEVVRQEQKASTSLLQRRLRLGYTRAARMVDILEQRGIVGPGEGAKAREVFLK